MSSQLKWTISAMARVVAGAWSCSASSSEGNAEDVSL